MIIKILTVGVEIIIAYLLQTTVFSGLRLADVVPDIFMILAASNALMFGSSIGALTGFFGGLVLDFTFGNIIGVYALIYTSLGYFCGYTNRLYDRDDYTLPLFLIGAAEFLYNIVYFVFFHMLKGDIDFGHYLVRYLCPRVIYTVIVSIILYRLLNFSVLLFDRIDRKKHKKSKDSIEYNGLDLFSRRNL